MTKYFVFISYGLCMCIAAGLLWVLDGAAETVVSPWLWQQLRIVPDALPGLTPEQAWERSLGPDALQLTHAHQPVAPANSAPYWAAWRMSQEDANRLPLWLSLQAPTQENSELWLRFNGGEWRRQDQLHETTNFGWGSGQLFPTWPIYDTSYRQIDLLVRIQSVNRVQFPLILQTPQAFMQQHLKLCLFIGVVMAAPMLMVFYALTFLPFLRSKTLMLFILFALLEWVAAAWISGLMSLLWPGISRVQNARLGCVAYGLLFGVSTYHAQAFLNTALHYPALHKGLHMAAASWWMTLATCLWLYPNEIRWILLLGGNVHAFIMLFVSVWHFHRQPGFKRAVFVSVWVVYLLGMLIYWLFRFLEWPLATTLGTHFVQGAVVTSMLGWCACMQVLRERDTLRIHMHLTRERSRWFAAAHHDLWQPMQSLLLYAKALVQADPDKRLKLLSGMQLASQSIDDFMSHLRFWSEGSKSNGSNSQKLQDMPIDDILRPLVNEMRLLSEQQQVMLRFRSSTYKVRVNSIDVMRMVRNLLTNAMRYTGSGGSVLLGCRRKSDCVWVWCMDNGVGMSEKQLEDAVEAFTRFDQTESAMRHLGLGLYSFRQLAQQMHLEVVLRSTPGKGTMIGFGLPLA